MSALHQTLAIFFLVVICASQVLAEQSYLDSRNSKPNLQFFVSVSGVGKDRAWARKQCELYYLALSSSGQARVSCDWNKEVSIKAPNLDQARRSNRFDAFIESFVDTEGTHFIRVVNWQRQHEIDFNQLGWKLEAGPNQAASITKLMRHVLNLKTNSQAIRHVLLANFAEDSRLIAYNESSGKFIDRNFDHDLKLDEAEKLFINESDKHKDYMTAAYEIASIMGVGLGVYYLNVNTNKRDWDYPGVVNSVKNLLNGNKIRFDDNGFKGVNWPHTYAAIPEYLLCRANGFSHMESFLCSFAASLVWKNIIEYREVFSINDQITTSLGGAIIGESLFQINRLFQSKRGSSGFNKIMASIFGSPDQFNRYVQRKYTKPKTLNLDAASFEPAIWGQAELYTKYERVTKDSTSGKAVWIGFEAKTFSLDGWNEVGKGSRTQKTTAATEFIFENVQNGVQTGKDFHLFSKVAFAAWQQKNLVRDQYDQLNGYQFFIGPASGLETRQGNLPNGKDDFFGVINILGATARLEMFSGANKVTAQLEFFGDFAMVRSLSIENYIADNTAEGLPSVLVEPNYYYAVGSTTRGQIVYERSKFAVGVEMAYHEWNSVNGKYRDQERVTNDIRLSDKQVEAEVFVKYKLDKNVQLKLYASIAKRHSEIEGKYSVRSEEKRIGSKLSYLF